MKVKQISVFIENKIGRLAEVTKVLSDNSVNIRALSLADTKDFGILRLIVNEPEKAQSVLKEQGYTARETIVLVAEVPDRPGGLYEVLNTFEDNNINVEYMYAFAGKREKSAIMIFRFDDVEKALKTIKKTDLKILTHEELVKLV